VEGRPMYELSYTDKDVSASIGSFPSSPLHSIPAEYTAGDHVAPTMIVSMDLTPMPEDELNQAWQYLDTETGDDPHRHHHMDDPSSSDSPSAPSTDAPVIHETESSRRVDVGRWNLSPSGMYTLTIVLLILATVLAVVGVITTWLWLRLRRARSTERARSEEEKRQALLGARSSAAVHFPPSLSPGPEQTSASPEAEIEMPGAAAALPIPSSTSPAVAAPTSTTVATRPTALLRQVRLHKLQRRESTAKDEAEAAAELEGQPGVMPM
jgi:hypothetical protein